VQIERRLGPHAAALELGDLRAVDAGPPASIVSATCEGTMSRSTGAAAAGGGGRRTRSPRRAGSIGVVPAMASMKIACSSGDTAGRGGLRGRGLGGRPMIHM
jgi:hypothetical protein